MGQECPVLLTIACELTWALDLIGSSHCHYLPPRLVGATGLLALVHVGHLYKPAVVLFVGVGGICPGLRMPCPIVHELCSSKGGSFRWHPVHYPPVPLLFVAGGEPFELKKNRCLLLESLRRT